jgi:hypothetical protein
MHKIKMFRISSLVYIHLVRKQAKLTTYHLRLNAVVKSAGKIKNVAVRAK